MPTQQKRMALTLKPDVERAVFDLADALAKPAATVVADLLEEMVPQLEGLAKVARAAKAGNKAAAKRALTHLFGDAMAEAMSISQPDMFSAKPAAKAPAKAAKKAAKA